MGCRHPQQTLAALERIGSQRSSHVQVARQRSIYLLCQVRTLLACMKMAQQTWTQSNFQLAHLTLEQVRSMVLNAPSTGRQVFRASTNGRAEQTAEHIVLEYECLTAIQRLCHSLMGETFQSHPHSIELQQCPLQSCSMIDVLMKGTWRPVTAAKLDSDGVSVTIIVTDSKHRGPCHLARRHMEAYSCMLYDGQDHASSLPLRWLEVYTSI